MVAGKVEGIKGGGVNMGADTAEVTMAAAGAMGMGVTTGIPILDFISAHRFIHILTTALTPIIIRHP